MIQRASEGTLPYTSSQQRHGPSYHSKNFQIIGMDGHSLGINIKESIGGNIPTLMFALIFSIL